MTYRLYNSEPAHRQQANLRRNSPTHVTPFVRDNAKHQSMGKRIKRDFHRCRIPRQNPCMDSHIQTVHSTFFWLAGGLSLIASDKHCLNNHRDVWWLIFFILIFFFSDERYSTVYSRALDPNSNRTSSRIVLRVHTRSPSASIGATQALLVTACLPGTKMLHANPPAGPTIRSIFDSNPNN